MKRKIDLVVLKKYMTNADIKRLNKIHGYVEIIHARNWHVYEGGNFVFVVSDGYEKNMGDSNYLGGPLLIAKMNHNVHTGDVTHEMALRRAKFICDRLHDIPFLIGLIDKLETKLKELE